MRGKWVETGRLRYKSESLYRNAKQRKKRQGKRKREKSKVITLVMKVRWGKR